MDLQRFFDYWNLNENPFQAEEARNDAVYARTLEDAVTHPDFQKIYGNPENPSTALVFGEKGSGKTAMRLMMERRLEAYNETRSGNRVWRVRYDDLNPILDRLSHNLSLSSPEDCLDKIRLSDHQDAILSLAVTELLDSVLGDDKTEFAKNRRRALRRMHREKRFDLAILGLLYDQPRHGERQNRWVRLKRLLRAGMLFNRSVHGTLVLLAGLAGLTGLAAWRFSEAVGWEWQALAIVGVAAFAGLGVAWLTRAARKYFRCRRTQREVRAVSHEPKAFTRGLWDLPDDAGILCLIPEKGDQDKRYEATQRFLRIVEELGYSSLIVFVDRVDEPVLVNSDTERMRKLIWPLLNNKFLQQEQFGAKMLLPIELGHKIESEVPEFLRQARLDKQNMVNPLRWTGATLYDLCTSRFRNCQREDAERLEELKDLFEEEVGHKDLVEALDQMHQPRDAFKFLYAVILRHCQNTPGESEHYKIPKLTLDYVRQEQSERVMNLYRGVSVR
ncbi:MAG: hypothetical protein ACLFO5_07110 [Opitutales bacterium]